jgi:hypothetical protein
VAKSNIEFNFNFDDRALKKAVNQEIASMASDLTRALGTLAARYQGKPLAQIKPEIQRIWAQHTGGSVTDPELTQFAEQIQAGQGIEVRLK